MPILTRGSSGKLIAALLAGVLAGGVHAADFDGEFAGNNDYGDVGLLQTPTARMRSDGTFGAGFSVVQPYEQYQFYLQFLPWLETTVRYTDITNRFYGPHAFSGNQHYKDKSADFKIRLLDEGRYLPQLALGVQDIGGTGLFSSEYLVANYHYFDFDFSYGLAWGRLGSAGGIPNPLGFIGHFKTDRYAAINNNNIGGQGGTPGVRYWFTGKSIGPFGGVEWKTPIKDLALRVEYDGNSYHHEALNESLRQNIPVNFGLDYRGLHGLDLGVGFERGNTLTARVALEMNFQKYRGVPKRADPPPVAVRREAAYAQTAPASAAPAPTPQSCPAPPPGGLAAIGGPAFIQKLRAALSAQGFVLIAADFDAAQGILTVWFHQDRYRNPAKAVGRAARVLSAESPAAARNFILVSVDSGMEMYRAAVPRLPLEQVARGETDAEALYPDNPVPLMRPGHPGAGYEDAEYVDRAHLPRATGEMGPAVRQSVGGPNGFYFGQLYWKLAGSLQLTDRLDFTSEVGFNIVNNFDQIKLQSNSQLPHVRSDVVKYLQQGADGLINLEADYTWSPASGWYHRMSAGIFEEMYAGVATEVLYRPYGRSWAIAADLNYVKQRGFDELFDFRPYQVATGHLTLYYKPDFHNMLFKLSVGRYLARDRGATLDISRTFASGIRAGLFATRTNVSAAKFGEGSFDKGLYIVIPLDLFFARSTRREAAFAFRPLTRDGGQMVYDGPELYSTVDGGQPSDFAEGAPDTLK